MPLLVLASSPPVTTDSEIILSSLSTGEAGTSGACCSFLSTSLPDAFSFCAPAIADPLLSPPAATVETFLFAVDTIDFTPGRTGFLVDAGLNFFGSRAGTGGLFVGVAPATTILLFVEPVELFLARTPGPAPPTAPGRVGVTRPEDPPRDARALLTFDTVEFVDVFLDLAPVPGPTEELAVRKVSLVVEILIPEVGRDDVKEDIVEVRDVIPRVLGDVMVLLRIVDV
jgi:hypothetical protein